MSRWLSRWKLGHVVFGGLFLVACSASGGRPFERQEGVGGSDAEGGGIPVPADASDEKLLAPDGACIGVTTQANHVPLDMYFMLDTSGSMAGPNLTLLKEGLAAFFKAPESEGIGISGNHFPIMLKVGSDETCEPSEYAKPAGPWEILPNSGMGGWITGLVAQGLTPSIPALAGAVDACVARKAENAERTCSVVFVSDGEPEGNCPPTGPTAKEPLGTIAAGAWAKGIPVFAIGFPGIKSLGQQVLSYIAEQGGTDVPFFIKEGAVTQKFVDALTKVQGTALACEYQMPTSDHEIVDPDFVRVIYTPGTGGDPITIPRKMTAEDCGAAPGWYYDNNDEPTKLVMCDSTCKTMRADGTGKVEILLGCSNLLH